MNDVQNEIGDERVKQRQIQLIQKITLSLLRFSLVLHLRKTLRKQ